MPALTWYFRNLQGGGPAGSWEIREVFPTGAEDATTTHNSCADCLGADKSSLLKPGATGLAFVAGLPETAAPPSVANQFGWFTDKAYSGTFDSGLWTFQMRHDDNRAQVDGRFIINVYACTTEGFGGTFRFLFQTGNTTDWWTGTTVTQSETETRSFQLRGEFVFINVWSHEATTQAGRVHNFHAEGAALVESTVSKIITTPFTPFVSGWTPDYLPPRRDPIELVTY